MDKDKLDHLQSKVGSSLGRQIAELEQVTKALEVDLQTSVGAEREKDQALLSAAKTLLQQLKDAQVNISRLINPGGK
ncbi:MAG TPA: hypothetical protein VGD65_08465 [Chryseosolibacter sp.]